MPINWLCALFRPLRMKSAFTAHIPASRAFRSIPLFRIVTNIYQILISPPCKREPLSCVVSWSRWWANCIYRSSATSIFVFVCTSSGRLAVRQLKAAFIRALDARIPHVIMTAKYAIVRVFKYVVSADVPARFTARDKRKRRIFCFWIND